MLKTNSDNNIFNNCSAHLTHKARGEWYTLAYVMLIWCITFDETCSFTTNEWFRKYLFYEQHNIYVRN